MKAVEKPKFKPLGRYSTNDVLEAFGIHRSTLRYYINKGLIMPLPRKYNRKENRFLGRDLSKLYDNIS